jgi:hypothetical protein
VNAGKGLASSADRRESTSWAGLVAAYREELGLAAVAVIRSAAGIRVVAPESRVDGPPAAGDKVEARWWCRRPADAARVAAAATARLRRRVAKDPGAGPATAGESDSPGHISAALALAVAAVAAAARRCNVSLYSDEETSAAAMAAVARVDAELERLRRAGELKSVNRSYRSYRMETLSRGEKAVPYAQWINKYREKLLRQVAAALRGS